MAFLPTEKILNTETSTTAEGHDLKVETIEQVRFEPIDIDHPDLLLIREAIDAASDDCERSQFCEKLVEAEERMFKVVRQIKRTTRYEKCEKVRPKYTRTVPNRTRKPVGRSAWFKRASEASKSDRITKTGGTPKSFMDRFRQQSAGGGGASGSGVDEEHLMTVVLTGVPSLDMAIVCNWINDHGIDTTRSLRRININQSKRDGTIRAFLLFKSKDEAQEAIKILHRQVFDHSIVHASQGLPRRPR